MGNQPSTPTREQSENLKKTFRKACKEAADRIAECDVLLLCTGAGFSADSGLAVYADVAKIEAYANRDLTYFDICQPKWIDDDPDLFYGFWGGCFNDYRKTQPHRGYEIIAKWRDLKNKGQCAKLIRTALKKRGQEVERSLTEQDPYGTKGYAGAFFSFTSNVDAHMYDYFKPQEVRECHGNIELWQCSGPCSDDIWLAPKHFQFHVDADSMTAPLYRPANSAAVAGGIDGAVAAASAPPTEDDIVTVGNTKGSARVQPLCCVSLSKQIGEHEFCAVPREKENDIPVKDSTGKDSLDEPNHPRCSKCGLRARPAILMFGDGNWLDNNAQESRYLAWKDAVLDLAGPKSWTDPENELSRSLKVCILEVGCGGNVTTVRGLTERTYADVTSKGGSCSVIRVNPDLPLPDDPDYLTNSDFISIMSTGLTSLQEIDKHIFPSGQSKVNMHSSATSVKSTISGAYIRGATHVKSTIKGATHSVKSTTKGVKSWQRT